MTRSARREAIAAMRWDRRAELEHELSAVAQADGSWVEPVPDAVHVHADSAAKSEQARGAERTTPDCEEVAERCALIERDDTRRVGGPGPGAAAGAGDPAERDVRAAKPHCGRNDHDAAAREQLEVHAWPTIDRRRDAGAVRGRRRVIARTDADRRRHERKQRGDHEHLSHGIPLAALLVLIGLVILLTGCGGSSGTKQGGITIQPAREYRLDTLSVVHPKPGKPAVFSYRIVQPDGTPLTAYRHGAGPHTGVHMIFVRRDLSTIVHLHPTIKPDGSFSETIAFPSAGPYRLVIDAYPQNGTQPNFQLFSSIDVAGTYRPKLLPALQTTQTVDGFRFTLQGLPHLRAIEPAFLHFTVTSPNGKPAVFTPWYGALAHAIFFRSGSLDYFHTHVCAPGASACTSAVGTTKVTGTSATPGKLTVGVLVPLSGTWRLFLQCRVDGHLITAPFTLVVR